MADTPDTVIQKVESALAGFSGLRYLAALTVGLSRALQTRYAFVSRQDPQKVHFGSTVVMAENGESGKTMLYDLRDAPCRSVLGGQSLTIPCNLSDFYPGQVGLSAYSGVPLRDAKGVVIGVLAVVSDKPFAMAGVDTVLAAFASPSALALSSS
jgi:hypothetical protein